MGRSVSSSVPQRNVIHVTVAIFEHVTPHLIRRAPSGCRPGCRHRYPAPACEWRIQCQRCVVQLRWHQTAAQQQINEINKARSQLSATTVHRTLSIAPKILKIDETLLGRVWFTQQEASLNGE